jgi:hypothetical protein
MSNIDQITSSSDVFSVDDEQLFTELTSAEGANVSGGAAYYLGNKSDITVNYDINGAKQTLEPWEEFTYYYDEDPRVKYDSRIGSGYKVATKYLTPGNNNFDRNGNKLLLTTGNGGPVANIVANSVNQ